MNIGVKPHLHNMTLHFQFANSMRIFYPAPVLVSFLLLLYSDKSNLREIEFILAFSSRDDAVHHGREGVAPPAGTK